MSSVVTLLERRRQLKIGGLQSTRGEKDLLDPFRRPRSGRRFRPAVLVGRRRNHPDRGCQLVGRLPQRMVLMV